jgi:hypothetical protein
MSARVKTLTFAQTRSDIPFAVDNKKASPELQWTTLGSPRAMRAPTGEKAPPIGFETRGRRKPCAGHWHKAWRRARAQEKPRRQIRKNACPG